MDEQSDFEANSDNEIEEGIKDIEMEDVGEVEENKRKDEEKKM